jgi:hypothetical protein
VLITKGPVLEESGAFPFFRPHSRRDHRKLDLSKLDFEHLPGLLLLVEVFDILEARRAGTKLQPSPTGLGLQFLHFREG